MSAYLDRENTRLIMFTTGQKSPSQRARIRRQREHSEINFIRQLSGGPILKKVSGTQAKEE